MSGQSRASLGEALGLLLEKFKQRSSLITTYELSDEFRTHVRSVDPRIRMPIKDQKLNFDGAINSISVTPELQPGVKSHKAALGVGRIYDWSSVWRPVQARTFEPFAAWPAVALDYPLGADGKLICKVRPFPIYKGFHLYAKYYPILPVTPPNGHSPWIKTEPEDSLHMKTVVRTYRTSLEAPLKDGTALSAQLRVRRRSLKLYRMSLATLDGYFKEIMRQKRLRSEDIELVGVFLIPGAGVQNLAVDVDQRLLFYRFSVDAGRDVALRTMIVAKDKSTGTLHAVFDQREGQMKG